MERNHDNFCQARTGCLQGSQSLLGKRFQELPKPGCQTSEQDTQLAGKRKRLPVFVGLTNGHVEKKKKMDLAGRRSESTDGSEQCLADVVTTHSGVQDHFERVVKQNGIHSTLTGPHKNAFHIQNYSDVVDPSSRERLQKLNMYACCCDIVLSQQTVRRDHLEQITQVLYLAKKNCPTEYYMLGLDAYAVKCAGPVLEKYFVSWDPEKDLGYGVSLVKQWKNIIVGETEKLSVTAGKDTQLKKSQAEYVLNTVIGRTVFHKLRTALLNISSQHPKVMLKLYQTWSPILPALMFKANLVETILLRLKLAATAKPSLETGSEEQAWKAEMCSAIVGLHNNIVADLGAAMKCGQIHPLKPGSIPAFHSLAKWLPPQSQGGAIVGMAGAVSACLRVLTLTTDTPCQESRDKFNNLMKWSVVIPKERMASLLQEQFLKRWLAILKAWTKSKPDYNLLCDWFLGWTDLIPIQLVQEAGVKDTIQAALDLIQSCVKHAGSGSTDNDVSQSV